VWAQVSRRIVSNESADILHMFNDLSVGGSGRLDTPLEGLTGVDLRPPGLLQQVVVANVCLAMCRGGGGVRLVLWSPAIASV
jgi:glutathionyl-hydroquinone reductase